jgi:hypothetical protein
MPRKTSDARPQESHNFTCTLLEKEKQKKEQKKRGKEWTYEGLWLHATYPFVLNVGDARRPTRAAYRRGIKLQPSQTLH